MTSDAVLFSIFLLLLHLSHADDSCNFESMDECLWYFSNSHDLSRILKAQRSSPTAVIPQRTLLSSPEDESGSKQGKESNFYVVVSGGGNVSNHYAYFLSKKKSEAVAMIVSPFYERTSPKCELILRHRVLGEHGSELLVTTEQLTLSVISHSTTYRSSLPNNEEDDDWIRPTLRARFQPEPANNEPWTSSRVAIGTFTYPSRIRIECHANGENRADSDLNVECHVDDVQLVNCEEELFENQKCINTKNKYICRSAGKQHCLRFEDLCDLHAECMEDEDESEELHFCSLVPPGARCNFEDLSSATGCQNWKFFSGFSNTSTSEKAHLVSLATSDRKHIRVNKGSISTMDRPGLPPSEYSYRGRLYKPGHFLFFSSYDHSTSSEHEIVYSYAVSPSFPPISNPSVVHKSMLASSDCIIRFFYCRTGSSPFQLFLVNKDKPQESKPLWSPPKDEHTIDPCEWTRGSAIIRPHGESKTKPEYYLKLSFAKIAGSLGSIAIDDFTMTPSCFINFPYWKSRLFPPVFNASSCGFVGSESPKVDICSELEEDVGDRRRINPKMDEFQEPVFTDKHKWIVPETAMYRVELYGASGGSLPSQILSNDGGAILANIRLRATDELSFVIGQQGSSPCVNSPHQKMSSKMRAVKEIICSKRPRLSDIEAIGKDVSSLVGGGGGGATFMFVNSQPIVVVGGGGGAFLELYNNGDSVRAEGGVLDSSVSSDSLHFSPVEWISGNGFSLISMAKPSANHSQSCADCEVMSGHAYNATQLHGGICPRNRLWNMTGGYGGGAASCGPGGGGGAGYTGGSGGNKAFGSGGSSAILLTSISTREYLWRSGANSGNGRVLMVVCQQHFCPINSTCQFSAPVFGKAPEMVCLCAGNDQLIPLNGTCPGVTDILIFNLPTKYFPLIILIFNIFLFVLLLLLCCSFKAIKKRQFSDKHCLDGHEMLGIEAEASRCAGNKIIGNPIYETLQLTELTHISRHLLRLERIIGHGAFGEVYEGYFLGESGNSRITVAIKSLPIESCKEISDDFETEAKLLSQFKHKNIVAFFGVSFEQQPKYIVLEYLEGGDLKNFLRESRPKFDQAGRPVEEPNLTMFDLVAMAMDIVKGCEHLEVTKFVHRDIAARNCLLTTKQSGRVVKIADFGMARDIYRNDYYRKGGKAFLPVRWMPPEAFLDGIFTTKTDVWAFGVLLWEIFSMGYVPYSGRENHKVMKLVVAGDRLDPPIGILSDVYNVMLLCWNTEAEKRPSFVDLVTFFTELLKREDVMVEPLPQIRYRQLRDQLSTTPSTTRDSVPLGEVDLANPSSTVSQATVSTVVTEGTSSTSYDSMPTTGDGVCRNVFPPYQAKLSDPLIKFEPNHRCSMMVSEQRTAGESSSSSHDDSTLHDSAASSIKYQIRPKKSVTQQENAHSAAVPPWRREPPRPPSERCSLPPLPPSTTPPASPNDGLGNSTRMDSFSTSPQAIDSTTEEDEVDQE